MASEDTTEELKRLLEELDALAPRPKGAGGPMRVAYRRVESGEVIEESLPPEGAVEEGEPEGPTADESPSTHDFTPGSAGPIAAVDCGIVRLAETEDGVVIALRATIVVDELEIRRASLFRTGPIYLRNHGKGIALYHLGKHLGRADFFVEVDESDPDNPRITGVKDGAADNAHQYADRFRNWLERLAQRVAVASITDGVVLFDGALTLRTRDTPGRYLEGLGEIASEHRNAIVAISKQSLLEIRGRSVRFWLNDVPYRAAYRSLTSIMRSEGLERVLGNVCAARFSPLGPTFRMDVQAVQGQSDEEAISLFYGSTLMRGGYPDILVRAHAYSYFTPPAVIELQAQASTKYGLVPQSELELSGVFGPFGGRFK